MPHGRAYFETLQRTASQAIIIELDLAKGPPLCLKVAHQWLILIRALHKGHPDRAQTDALFRGIYAKMFPASASYYNDMVLFSDEELHEKCWETYAILSAIGRGDTEITLVSQTIRVCSGIAAMCDDRLREVRRLPPPAAPKKRPAPYLVVQDGERVA